MSWGRSVGDWARAISGWLLLVFGFALLPDGIVAFLTILDPTWGIDKYWRFGGDAHLGFAAAAALLPVAADYLFLRGLAAKRESERFDFPAAVALMFAFTGAMLFLAVYARGAFSLDDGPDTSTFPRNVSLASLSLFGLSLVAGALLAGASRRRDIRPTGGYKGPGRALPMNPAGIIDLGPMR